MTIEDNIPLAAFTTFHLGGPARYFIRVKNSDELEEALSFAKEKELKVLILGGGSNVLIKDEGFDGLVIKIELTGIEKEGSTLIATAGEIWDALVERAVKDNLWGIENLSGIPGTVGGAVSGSIGAYGQAIAQTVAWVEVLDAQIGEIKKMSNAECRFGYRESVFKSGKWVIVRAAFSLSQARGANLSYRDPNRAYKDLSRVLAGNESPSLTDIRAAILAIRAEKFPDLALEGTGGSFFKNPILPEAQARDLAQQYAGLPLFPVPEEPGKVKVPIAWLMDHVLEMHGLNIGAARLFEKQILVIVAKKNCTAAEVRALASAVQKKVMQEFGLAIEPEVKII